MGGQGGGRKALDGRGVTIHVHGGGFAYGNPPTERIVACRLSQATARPAFAVDYREPAVPATPATTRRWYIRVMDELDAEVVQPAMLERPVDPARYGGVVRPDKTVRWAADELEQVRQMRGRSPDTWPRPTALPESLDQLAEWLTELGWDDLSCLARREELAVYRTLSAGQPGLFGDQIVHALAALRRSLMECGRHEEALEVVEELLRLPETNRSARAEAPDARYWRTLLLARLGRDQEAVESAAEAVTEISGRLQHAGATSARFELIHALTAYADRLDKVGRVAEAAEVSAQVMAAWWQQADSTVRFLQTLDLRRSDHHDPLKEHLRSGSAK